MKAYKKLGIVLCFLLALTGSLALAHKALAAGCSYVACSQQDITGATNWTLQDQYDITAVFNGKKVTFTDNKPGDGNHRYDAKPGVFCSGGGGGSLTTGVGSITIPSDSWDQLKVGNAQVLGSVDIDYYDASHGTTAKDHCVSWKVNGQNLTRYVSNPNSIFIVDNSDWLWQGNNIVSGDHKTTLTSLNSDGMLYGKSTKIGGSDGCNGNVVIKLDSPQSSSGYLYKLQYVDPTPHDTNDDSVLVNASGQPYYTDSGKCYITSGANGSQPISIIGSFSATGGGSSQCVLKDTGEWKCTDVSGGTVGGGGDPSGGASGDSCGLNSNGLSIAWLLCPTIEAANGLAVGLEKLYEDQLSFTVSQLVGQDNSQNQTRGAWVLMKNLASAFLVIIMLIMVFAQAIGGGPIDAYTMRKMLPRLVVAVILIQVSWYLLAWVVDLFNAIGNGIADLLFLPFGGSKNMQLGSLFAHAHVSGLALGPLSYAGLALVIAFGVADLPMLLLLLLGVVVSLVAALVMLMFRKILIIICLIFAPIALLAWILPGTQRYYKMWSDNLLKALFMFPLVVAIIAGGRIFAYIAGTQKNGTFLTFFMVLVGFFGPLFILPKTFKWGGQVMQMTGNGISQGFNKLSSPGESYLKGLHQRSRWMLAKQTRESIRMHEARQGFADGLTRSGVRGTINRARLVRPGRPSDESRLVRRAVQQAQIEKAKAWEEERSAAEAELTMVLLPQMINRGASHDLVREAIALKKENAVVGREVIGQDAAGNNIYQDIVFNGKEYADTHHLSQRAALDRMVVHGQWGAIDEYLNQAKDDPEQRAMADGFKNDSKNAPAIGAKLTHQLKGWGVAVNSDEGAIGNMSGHEVESILAHYTQQIAAGRAPGASPEAQAIAAQAATALQGFRARFHAARRSPSVHLDVRAVNAMDAYEGSLAGNAVSIQSLNDINTGAVKMSDARARGDIDTADPRHAKDTKEGVKREGSRVDYSLETIIPVQ